MTALQTYLAALAPGIDIVAGCAGMSEDQLCAAGAPNKTARTLLTLADALFAPTSFSRLQRQAVNAARERAHPLPTLEVIERYAARAKTKRDAWRLRVELCRTAADTEEMEKLARKKLRELNPPAPPRPGVRIRRRKDAPWTLAITGPSSLIADLESSLDEDAPLDSVAELFSPSGAAPATRPTITTNAIITLDELDRIIDGDGEEITIRLTNGARLTGAELVSRTLAERGLITLVHPYEGAVNLYRTERMASEKQRLMAAAENPVCPWPACNYPADKCQVHHLQAWRHGGETNMSNLATCCPYHNGVNDDDPNAPSVRGRLVRRRGRVVWQPPWPIPPHRRPARTSQCNRPRRIHRTSTHAARQQDALLPLWHARTTPQRMTRNARIVRHR